MPLDLSSKVCLVTGADEGLGFGLVQGFLTRGAHVAAGLLHPERSQPRVAPAFGVPMDVTQPDQVAAAVADQVKGARARAEAVAAQLSAPITVIDWQDRAQALAGVSLLVNTTSQGMVGMAPLDLALDHLPPSAIVADIIYTPLQSPLLEQAAARGHQTLNGLGMLLYQGVPAWKLWFGVEPQVTETLRELMVQSLVGS